MRKIEPRELTEMDQTQVTDVMPFFTVGEGWISKLIKRVTGVPTHVGLLFKRADGWVYMEALIGRNIQAPESIARLCAWPHRAKGRIAVAVELMEKRGLDRAAVAQSIYNRALQDVGRCTYNPWQLLCLWASIRLHLPVPSSPGKVICSEWVGLCLSPWTDLRPIGRSSWDRLTPAEIYVKAMRNGRAIQHNLKAGAPV